MYSKFYAINNELLFQNSFKVKIGPAQPKPVKGNKLIIFDKHFEKKVFFIGTSEVLETRTINKEGESFFIVKIDDQKEFDEPRELFVIAGSLKKVYRFIHPERHFRRMIVALDWEDYQTIIENQIDVTRSVFRYLFSCLPNHIQIEFIKTSYEGIGIDSKNLINDYSKACEQLIKFYQERIGGAFRILSDFYRIHKQVEDSISKVPGLKSLQLVGRDENVVVPLGELTEKARNFFISSNVFRDQNNNIALLSEVNSYLDKDEGLRKWQDPIF